MLPHVALWLQDLSLGGLLALTVWRGSRLARLSALLLMSVAVVIQILGSTAPQTLPWRDIAADAILTAWFIRAALVSHRRWPFVAAAFCLVATCADVLELLIPFGRWAFTLSDLIWTTGTTTAVGWEGCESVWRKVSSVKSRDREVKGDERRLA